MTSPEEEQLIKDAKSSNEQFVKLYDKYYPQIFGYVFRRTLDFERSRDIVSETFFKALLNIGRFQWRDIAFSSWLFRIATNEMNMADRKNKYRPRSLEEMMHLQRFQLTDPQTTESEKRVAEKRIQENQSFLLVQQKLKLLPVKYREVITLRYFEEKPVKEIAEILGKKEGTVKSLLSRGMERLRILM
jgi:RNA polymerase sigma-70 factor (ECF subfamily)